MADLLIFGGPILAGQARGRIPDAPPAAGARFPSLPSGERSRAQTEGTTLST
jgi:hypothetical protein